MKPSLRFAEIDLLRGFACLAVLLFHYFSRAPRAGWMLGVDYPAFEAVARYGYLGVHLFFVISGFVILLSAHDATPRGFVASRVARLYPTLWVGATLTAGTAWLLAEPRFAVSLPDYLVNLTMFPHWFHVPYVDGAYWSLGYELHFYIFVWLALRLRLMDRLPWLLTGWLAISALNAIKPMWPVQFWLNAKWAPFFVAGGVFYLMRVQGATMGRYALLAASYCLALFYAVDDALGQGAGPEAVALQPAIVSAVVTAIFGVFWLIATGRFTLRPGVMTIYAGLLTYPVYVIHQFFGAMLFELLRKSLGSVPLAMALVIACVAGLAWLIHVAVERPLGKRLRRWLDDARGAKPIASPVS